jgi:rhodanese-related sulfurtransferase
MNDLGPIAITPQQALQMTEENPRAIIVDIRSSMEFLFVGHPTGAVHVPWIDEPDWVENPDFVTDIRKLILGGAVNAEDCDPAPVILICRSGKRSLVAGKVLLESGLTQIYHIEEGFEGDRDENHHRGTLGGWRFHDLPWEQC